MFSLFATPLGFLMKGCYKLIGNYGIALLVFTLLTRLLMLPLSIKQQKSTVRMSMIQPELEKIKKKYGKNTEKLNEETMALYQKHGVNPMASCLPMLISMLILFSMIPVIYGPLTYVSDLDKDTVTKSNNTISMVAAVSQEMKADDTTMAKLLEENGNDFAKVKEVIVKEDSKNYKNTYKLFGIDSDTEDDEKKDKEKLWNEFVDIFKKHPDIDTFITNSEYISQSLVVSRPELATFDFVDTSKADAKYKDILPNSVVEFAEGFKYEFFGLSLGAIPNFSSWLAIIPILSFVLQLVVTIVSNFFTRRNNPAQKMGMAMKIMLFGLPLFSLWIAFEYPAGLGLYWIYSSMFALLQTIFLNIIYTPAKIRTQVEAEMERNKERRKSGKLTFMERAIEMQKDQKGENSGSRYDDDDDDDDGEESEEKKLSKAELKELQRQKLNEARKRMAEKYGDEYTEE
ncbi:MAG: membrane protein insertase YidC [Lachnospiraceae bacterium]|nr:membrane protein insertase YidC [Lachnospiraceae bacterium]MBR4555375.1 membrane protein insertase YidC [Ruminococcus sp.]